jgi:2-iminobutanoate/2-iminopropanoate deaminase
MESQKKDTLAHGMPWEAEYGYAQGLKQDGTVWLSGQLGHDENGMIVGNMETQMRQAYANIRKLLNDFDMDMGDVVGELVFVLDIKAAYDARSKVGREVYPNTMQVTSTLIGIAELGLPDALVEIKIVAKKPVSASQ